MADNPFDSIQAAANPFDEVQKTGKAPTPKALDYLKQLGSSAIEGVGSGFQFGGELAGAALNHTFGTQQFEAVNPLKFISDPIRDSMSDAGKAAAADGFKGDIFKPSTYQAPDTAAGYGMGLAQGVGSLASTMAPLGIAKKIGVGAKGMQTLGAVIGGATTGGAAADDVREGMGRLTEEQLQQSPAYNQAIASGMDTSTARQKVINDSALAAGSVSALAGAAGGAFNAKFLDDLIEKKGIAAALGNSSGNRAVRAGVGLAGGVLAEGSQEGLEKIGQNIGENIGRGDATFNDVSRDTLGDVVMGGLVGGKIGSIAGAFSSHSGASNAAISKPNPIETSVTGQVGDPATGPQYTKFTDGQNVSDLKTTDVAPHLVKTENGVITPDGKEFKSQDTFKAAWNTATPDERAQFMGMSDEKAGQLIDNMSMDAAANAQQVRDAAYRIPKPSNADPMSSSAANNAMFNANQQFEAANTPVDATDAENAAFDAKQAAKLPENGPLSRSVNTGIDSGAVQTANGAPASIQQTLETASDLGQNSVVMPANASVSELPIERRTDEGRRKAIDEMDLTETRKALGESTVIPGMRNRRAFDDYVAKNPNGVLGYADGDNFKQINTALGHETADNVLQAMGKIYMQAEREVSGALASHRSGDEFVFHFKSDSVAKAFDARAREIAAKTILRLEAPDGKIYEFRNPGFSFGTGSDLKQAETASDKVKAERVKSGERSATGQAPRGFSQVSSEGVKVSGGIQLGDGRKDVGSSNDVAFEAKTPEKPQPSTEVKSVHYKSGHAAYADGQERNLPSYFVGKSLNAKLWLKGYDAAKSLTPRVEITSNIETKATAPNSQDSNQLDAAKPTKPATSANTIFTDDAAAKARAILKSKLGTLNSGIDPEILQAGITLAGYHIEKGARSFSAFAKAMIDDLGDSIRPYLRSFYMGIKYDPRAAKFDGMSSASDVESFDVDAKAALENDAPAPPALTDVAPTIVEHVTGKGKTLRGVIRTDLSLDEAKAIDPYTFKKDGGLFIREKYLSDTAPSAAPTTAPIAAPEKATDQLKQTLATHLQNKIAQGDMPEDNPALKKLVEAFDGEPASQARMKEAQEAFELALVNVARKTVAAGRNTEETYEDLLALYERQPNLNIRTSTSIANQAYSTPAPLAYLASQLASVTQKTLLYEPTAGNGMLTIGADPARVTVNELERNRIDALKSQGFAKVLEGDATKVDVAPKSQDAIITNPPFGSIKDSKGEPTKVIIDGYRIGQIDHLIAARALDAMKDDGKATLIIGANKVAGGLNADDRIFFNWLYSHYNVTGHFEVNGDLYARQGAGWPVRVIQISGRQETKSFAPIAGTIKRADNWKQVYEQFSQILDSSGEQSNASASDAVSGIRVGETKSDGVSRPVRAQNPKPAKSDGANRGASNVGDVAGAGSQPLGNSGKRTAGQLGAGDQQQRLGFEPVERDRLDAAGTDKRTAPAKSKGDIGTNTVAGNEFQVPYIPRSARKDEGILIPVNMESPLQDALSKLEDAVGDIDQYAAKQLGYDSTKQMHEALMGLQVDSVASAIYQIEQGKAVVIADQCVAAGTKIFDPVNGTHTEIEILAKAAKPINVLALTNNGLRHVAASAPFLKGRADLFRVTTDDGRSITVTRNHRFLSKEGWSTLADGLRVGSFLASAVSLLENNSAFYPSVHAEDDPHLSQTSQDCLGGCLPGCHLCDEQLLFAQASGQSSLPSLADAPEHIRYCFDVDGLDASTNDTRPHQFERPPSKNSFFPLASRAPSQKTAQAHAFSVLSLEQTRQNVLLSAQSPKLLHKLLPEAFPHPLQQRSTRPSAEFSHQQLSGNVELFDHLEIDALQLLEQIRQIGKRQLGLGVGLSYADHTGWSRIADIEFVGYGDFYDLWVPGYENYVAEGLINHNTGIGKGRQAAAIIRYAIRKGHVPVFISVKPSLFTDMYGDLHDIGSDDVKPFIMNGDAWISGDAGEKLFSNKAVGHKRTIEKIRDTGQLPDGANALFMTYSQINTENAQRGALLSLSNRAVFVLDESHNAGGDSKTGEFMIGALDTAKGATYLSATYAKRPDNMPLYFKTDIGQAIADNEALTSAMAQGGLPLQTVVSNNLVKAGQMFRRERSYDGVSIEAKIDTENRANHEKLSDETTQALRAIVDADTVFHAKFVKAKNKEVQARGGIVQDNAGNQATAGVEHTQFSSVVHNFVKQMLLGLKAQGAADLAIQALKRNEKPIIAVENTMGSFLNEYANDNQIMKGGSLGNFDYRTVLSRALARTRVLNIVDERGVKTKQNISLSELDPASSQAYRDAQKMIDSLKIDIPVSPIDWIRSQIQKAGYTVAEITGRELAVDYSDAAKPVLGSIDKIEKSDKVRTTRLFNSGQLDALILNVSGSTGISLHASEKFEDKRQRHMIVAQPASDINIFMQMLGRVHRTGQVALPKYTLLSADLPTEKRPTAMLSKKMKSLNANTSSNTESATSVKTADMLNKYGDQVVGQYLEDNPELMEALGIKDAMSDGKPVEDIARKATGRLALQSIKTQQEFYEEIEGQYNSLMEYLNKTNQNDLEPRTFDFDAQERSKETLFEGRDKTSPFGDDAIYGEYSIKAQGEPMKPAEIHAAMTESLAGLTSGAHVTNLDQNLYGQFIKYRAKFDPETSGKAIESADKVSSFGRNFIQNHAIGSVFRVDINGDTYNAIVTNIRSTHKTTGNPLAASKIQVTVALNGALRSITVPASQFIKIETAQIGSQTYRIEQLFKEQPPNQRETAKIVTGNLLAAFGELQGSTGTIISFTKQDGTIEQGILLPKNFDFKTGARDDYRLTTSADALKFLQNSTNQDIGRFGISSRDNDLRVMPSGRGVRIQVPKSKLKGAKYFLDAKLLAVTGDFTSQGERMVAVVNGAQEATQALDVLMKKTALYALPSMAQEAKAMLGNAPVASRQATENEVIRNAFNAEASLNVGLPVSEVQKAVAQTGINVKVVQTDSDIPVALRESLKSRDLLGNIDGLFDPKTGQIYLVASKIPSQEAAVTVALHEAAHRGLRHLFGLQIVPALNAIHDANDDVQRKTAAMMQKEGIGKIEAIEEVLANMAEAATATKLSGWDKIVKVITDWLTKHGINLKLSDDQVQTIVAGSVKAGKEQVSAQVIKEFSATDKDSLALQGEEARASRIIDALKNDGLKKTFTDEAASLFTSQKTFNLFHKSVGTQYHKAQVDSDFRPVYETGQQYLRDTATIANEAADLAPNLLPKLQDSVTKALTLKSIKAEDEKAVANAIFGGTLGNVVYTSAEDANLTPEQFSLYKETRAAIEYSLDSVLTSQAARQARTVVGARAAIAEAKAKNNAYVIADRLNELAEAEQNDTKKEELRDMARSIDEQATRIQELKADGYAPLSRFGQYSVYTVEDGKQVAFTLHESQKEANDMAKIMRESYPRATVTQGVLSAEANKLFQGISPDTLELFGNTVTVGPDSKEIKLSQTKIFQDYLKLTVNNRSALARLINRKGIEGYSTDVSRVLATFITSNARAASGNYHFGNMLEHVENIPKEKGDVKDEAVKLLQYLQNPKEEAAALRGFLFVNYLGGSIASSLVNMTQPILQTLPYLSQFGSATKHLTKAMTMVSKSSKNTDPELKEALQRAEKDGVVSPQEIHQLYAESSRTFGSNRTLRRALTVWGSLFSLAEQFNRRVTFIAAYNLAREEKIDNPFAFAEKAVEETQGVYNRGNRPNWARGALGATLFTFKQFTVSYLEFLKRLPRKQQVLALAIMVMASGAQGLPFAGDADDLIDALAQALGYNFNSKQAKRKFLADALGDGMAEFVMHGASMIPGMPLDVQGRLGLGKVIPGIGALKKSDTSKARDVMEIFGPAGSLLQSGVDAAAKLVTGDVFGAAKTGLPTSIQNMLKAVDMARFDMYRDQKGRKVIATDGVDAFMKGIGFQPSNVAQASRKMQMVNQNISLVKVTESEISEKIAQGRFENDPAKVQDAYKELREWNQTNPEAPIKITPAQVVRRVKEMSLTRDDRLSKTAPKEIRASVGAQLRQ